MENITNHCVVLRTHELDTPLGPMRVVADEAGLYMLEFADRRGLELKIHRLCHQKKLAIIPGITSPMTSIDQELKEYFSKKRMRFETPFHLLGSPFQKAVWNELLHIPYGETQSYLEQAKSLDKPNAFRAVANANGANQLAIIVPCHRIIRHSGDLGGYGGGIERKKFLLEHEAACRQ